MLIQKDIDFICEQLSLGKILAYPTETLWVLGVDISQDAAVESISRLKPRAQRKPMSILVADKRMAREYVELDDKDEELMDLFWPGPLTIILPAKSKVNSLVRGGGETIGLRCSAHPFARRLVRKFQKPISTTSAHRSGQAPSHSKKDLSWVTDDVLIVDDNTLIIKNPGSTVIQKISTGSYQLIREGQIESQLLENYCQIIR